jgi:Mlc titration factor MtfA (ptsG expression regulator)
MFSRLRAWRRQRAARALRVAPAQWQAVERRLPFLDFLPAADRPPLRQMALEFLAEKEMSGAGGFRLSDEVQLSVALQACLPVLKLGLDRYRGWVGVLVYPGDFVIPRQVVDEAGVVHTYDDPVLGEAWEGGPVVLSWQEGGGDADGINVVIHEFAHKLDMGNGAVDGMPALHPEMRREDWSRALGADYRDFRAWIDAGNDSWLDPYAAESPSEFFAVAAEAFFETPLWLREDFPATYGQFRLYFRQDPAAGEEQAAPRDPP